MNPFFLRDLGMVDYASSYAAMNEYLEQGKPVPEAIFAASDVVAPGLLKAPLRAANDILSYSLLQLESRTGDWGRWLTHHGTSGLRPAAMLFDQFATMTQGAIHGLGIALVPLFLIERELADNRLVPVFGQPIKSLGSYFLVWPKDLAPRAPLTSFRAWLSGELSA